MRISTAHRLPLWSMCACSTVSIIYVPQEGVLVSRYPLQAAFGEFDSSLTHSSRSSGLVQVITLKAQ